MIKSLIPFFFQTNLSFAFPLVSLVVFVLSIFLLLTKTSSLPKPRSVSSSVSPGFNEDIVATLLIHIDTLSLPMSHFLRTLLCSQLPTLPVLMSYLYLFFIPSQIPHLYLRLLHLDHCRFILVVPVLTPGPWLTHLLWLPPPRHWSCYLPLIFPLPFAKVLVPLVILILFIISCLITAYLHHILLLFPHCLLFLFLKLCMRPSLIRARNMQWLKKWLIWILLAHGT